MRPFFCALVGCLALANAFCAEVPHVGWRDVDGAGGYLVEIRSGETITSQTVTKPSVDLQLLPGVYQMRVTTLDRFLKPAGRTEWTKFSVARAVTPSLIAVSPDAVPPGESRFVVEGSGFSASTDVVLVTPQGEVAVSSKRLLSDRQIEFSASLTPGTYGVVLRNPPGQFAKLPGGVTVTTLPNPEVVHVPEVLPNPVVNVPPTVASHVPFRLGGGYGVLVPLGAWSAVVGPSYQDVEAFGVWPVWDGAGPLVRVGFSGFNSKTGTGLPTSRLNAEAVAAGASWDIASLPLRVWLAPGVALTQASTSTSTASSLDLLVSAGATLTFPINDHLFWELGSDYRVVFYTGTPLQSMGLSARSGITF